MSRRGDNIHKRKDGRWEGRYISSREPNGKATYSSVYGKTYTETKAKLKQFQQQNRMPKSECTLTIDEIALKWLNEDIKTYKKYSTYVKYEYIYNNHIKPHIGDRLCTHIHIDECIQLIEYEFFNYNKNKLSKSTISSIKNVLNQILKAGNIPSRISSKDIKALEQNQYEKTQFKIFTRDEQEKMVENLLCDLNSYKLGILVCMLTGLRLGEICALKTADIDLDKRMLYVRRTAQRIKVNNDNHKTELIIGEPKTKSSIRTIPICDLLFSILQTSIPVDTFLVNGKNIMEPRTYQCFFRKYQESLSIHPINFHALRHTFATNCVENGMDIKCLSEILGHSNVQITLNRYVHPSYEQKLKQLNSFTINYGQINGQNS